MPKPPETRQVWSKMIRGGLKRTAQSITSKRGSIELAAEALGLSRAAIEKMKSSGSGSVESWIRLLAFGYQLSADEVEQLLNQLPRLIKDGAAQSRFDPIEQLYFEARRIYSDQELASWLRLLVSKGLVEEQLGLNIKATPKRRPIAQAADSKDSVRRKRTTKKSKSSRKSKSKKKRKRSRKPKKPL